MISPIRLIAILFCLAAPPLALAQPPGRLFFPPDERARLDRMRFNESIDETQNGQTRRLNLNGLVYRGNGSMTVWINQRPQSENERSGVIALKPPKGSTSVPLLLPSGEKIRLRPGQQFDPQTGRVSEGFATGNQAPVAEQPKR